MKKITVNFTLNGQPVSVETTPHRRLLDLLREDLRLTGTKEGCAVGECGACTVILDALQCGFCTPGFIMSAKALLEENPDATVEEIRRAISGNLCRCTGYEQLTVAIYEAAQELKAAGKGIG